jgi:hypothetical protein
MRLKEVENKLGYGTGVTSVQREVICRTLLGEKIERTGEILDIHEDSISLRDYSDSQQDKFDSDRLSYSLYYNKEKFGQHLMTYSGGDIVEIVGKIKKAEHSYPTELDIDLLSITKINTAEERMKISKEIEEKEKKKNGSCFIATACYGDYDAAEVLILRKYRDEILLKTIIGRTIVWFYYLLSPPIARLIEKSDYLRYIIQKYLLNPIVSMIQHKKIQ